MVTLITAPRPEGFRQRPLRMTGAQRAAARLAEKQAALGPIPPTKETRQNFRAMLRKAQK